MKTQDFKKRLSTRVKELRNNMGMSQEEVAKKLGLHRVTVTQIESGDREITAEELTKLAMVFGVDLETLIGEQKEVPTKTVNEGDVEITFFRHGEATDDVYDQYGGWADPELSPKGINKAFNIAVSLKQRGMDFEIIYSSPLKRARQLAEVMGRELKTDVKVMQYLKERNTYGLLCGVNKTIGKKRFPELVKAYENGEYVLGSERSGDFEKRIPMIFDYIKNSKLKNVACVTHGKVLTAVIKQTLKMNPENLDEGCMLKMGMAKDGFYYIQSEGIIFKK